MLCIDGARWLFWQSMVLDRPADIHPASRCTNADPSQLSRSQGQPGFQGRTATVLLRGSNKLMLDEADRSLHDALCVVRSIVHKRYLIAGGAAPEVEVSLRLSEWAQTLQGMESVCVRAFAEALEIVPYTLAENSGLDPIHIVTTLRCGNGARCTGRAAWHGAGGATRSRPVSRSQAGARAGEQERGPQRPQGDRVGHVGGERHPAAARVVVGPVARGRVRAHDPEDR